MPSFPFWLVGGFVRYRTAAILSGILVVLVGGMFGFSAAVWAIFLPFLDQGFPDPVPVYEQVLLHTAVFCGVWKLPLAVLARRLSWCCSPSQHSQVRERLCR
jgi:hypothetical protein